MFLGEFLISFAGLQGHTEYCGPFSTIEKAHEQYEVLVKTYSNVWINRLTYNPCNPKMY